MKAISKILIGLLVVLSINAQANNESDSKSDANTSTTVATLTISGQVVDVVTGEALVGVTVKIDNTTTYTDFEGNFSATVANLNSLKIITNLISYNPQEIIVEPSSSKNIKVALNPLKN